MDGMLTWRFNTIMDCIPVSLQASLLLLLATIAYRFFRTDTVVAGTFTGFVSFGLLLYILAVIAGTLSYKFPLQTPFSLALRPVIRFNYLEWFREWYRRTLSEG